MNHATVAGKVSAIQKEDGKFIAFKVTTGFGEYTSEVSVMFSAGKPESAQSKKVAALCKYLEEGGEISVGGSLTTGSKGMYLAGTQFFVGGFKPYNKDGAAAGGGKDSGLPF